MVNRVLLLFLRKAVEEDQDAAMAVESAQANSQFNYSFARSDDISDAMLYGFLKVLAVNRYDISAG